jgi:lysyl-tRNA synthetase class 2
MPNEEQLIDERRKKREELLKLKAAPGSPYPYSFNVTAHAGELAQRFAGSKPETSFGEKASVAGRLMALRRLGKITFGKLEDQSGAIQIWWKDNLKDYDTLRLVDIGDIVGVNGEVITTKTGELTVLVESWTLLTKTLRPLPDKWHGLKDIEERYRRRYVDLIMSPSVREVFLKRSKIIASVRQVLDSAGFVEVETPILEPVYGGANAKPFVTEHNDLKMKMYLKVSPELYLKRLLVGGFERVYEITKDFRNEGIDTTHNPEFTECELYQAYADYHDMMTLLERVFEQAAIAANGSTTFKWGEHTIDVKAPWQRLTMKDALKKYASIDVDKLDEHEILKLRTTYNLTIDGEVTPGTVIAELFDELVSGKLIQPVHIIDHPKETTPLCKLHRKDPALIERFESFIGGMEVSNAYSELNDPVRQRELLEEQAKQLRAGIAEAHPMDEDFVRAIEQGMPPAGGLGFGIDRMVMFITGQTSIRDVIFFPTQRPENKRETSGGENAGTGGKEAQGKGDASEAKTQSKKERGQAGAAESKQPVLRNLKK